MIAVHKPVLLEEVLDYLALKENGIYIDGTFGRGGHAQAILEKVKHGRLLAFDKDSAAVQAAKSLSLTDDPRFTIYHASFADMYEQVQQKGLAAQIDGILLDLGVSSPQLDEADRGFSFLRDGPLDMRM